ncbi:8379_t:CDS:2 [Entrophospora sp. SA101]|nr:8379_t:CDS:2 [Entrophospora sp. SA101]
MRKWNLAKGDDTSIYECTLEHWASYLAVNDTQIAKIEKVPARTDIAYVAYLLPFISNLGFANFAANLGLNYG